MKISIVQENPVVGDVEGNLRLAFKTIDRLKKEGPDVVLFSEMFLTGYPPEDLLLRDDLYLSLDTALEKLVEHSPDINIVIGYPRKKNKDIYNAAGLLYGEIGRASCRERV